MRTLGTPNYLVLMNDRTLSLHSGGGSLYKGGSCISSRSCYCEGSGGGDGGGGVVVVVMVVYIVMIFIFVKCSDQSTIRGLFQGG